MMVVRSGRALSRDNRANRRMEAISYRASSMAPSLRLYPVSYTDLWSFGEINAEMRAERLLPLARVRLGGGALEA